MGTVPMMGKGKVESGMSKIIGDLSYALVSLELDARTFFRAATIIAAPVGSSMISPLIPASLPFPSHHG